MNIFIRHTGSGFLFLLIILNSCEKKEVPTITTSSVTSITGTSVTCGGTVENEGSGKVTDRGVCWSTGITPTIADNKKLCGAGPGTFTSNIPDLNGATTYYVRAWATNEAGTGYGEIISFSTLGEVPTATTLAASKITPTTAKINGSVNPNFVPSTVTFEYGMTGGSVNTINASTSTVTGNSDVPVSAELSNLLPATNYTFRVKAVNNIGETWGESFVFTTLKAGQITDVEGNIYNTVTIGTQIWMAENLKTTRYNDDTGIPLVTDNTTWKNLTSAAYCWYNNDKTTYGNIYGALYNFRAAWKDKLCPVGWHVPTDDEWVILMNNAGGSDKAGGRLKETGTEHWASPNTGATNETGFTALPGGLRIHYSGEFAQINQYGYIWLNIWAKVMGYNNTVVVSNTLTSAAGCSIRCIKNK